MRSIYFKAAVRNIIKNKLYSVISITGLALGIAVSLMIAIFVRHETSFDSMYPDHERMYRINWEHVGSGTRFATFFNAVTPTIAENLPDDIEAFTRIAPNTRLLTIGDKKFREELSFVDPNFFEIFPIASIAGDLSKAFDYEEGVVLTRAAAEKLFGSTDVVGALFTVENKFEFKVSAVIENMPTNSHLTGNIFIHIEKTPDVWGWPNIWESEGSDQFYHYIKLREGVTAIAAESHIVAALDTVMEGASEWARARLQPFDSIHFTTDLQNETSSRNALTGDVKPFRQLSDIYIFVSVALLTFTIAVFNFLNMQFLQITNRIKEVGIRKTLGASRGHIIIQFMLEACILVGAALVTGLVIVEITLPMFAENVAAPLTSTALFGGDMLLLTLGATLVAAIAAGVYPALAASRHLPSAALRGEVLAGSSATRVRSILIVLQFAIAIGLISSSGIVNGQIKYAMSKALGFESEGVVTVALPRALRRSVATLKTQLENHPSIASVATGSVIPTGDLSSGNSFNMSVGGQEVDVVTRRVEVDEGYFQTLGMTLAAGRVYSRDFPADKMPNFPPENLRSTAGIILNEKALRNAGIDDPQSAIGAQLWQEFSRDGKNYRLDYTLVGVVKDAHYRSIRSEIAPISYAYDAGSSARTLIVKVKEGQMAEGLKAIDAIWAEIAPDYPIDKALLRETYNAFYASENRTFSLFIGFAGLAMLIACLGLWGLTSFIIERRTKEIGIRKVMGATVRHIITMLTWDFSRLVIIANVIAWPTAWWIMNEWLSNFAYQSEISVAVFIVAASIVFLLATVTTSSRAYIVAQMNPAKTLRQE